MAEQGVRWELTYEYMAEPDYGDVTGCGAIFTERVSIFDDKNGEPARWLTSNTIGRRAIIPNQNAIDGKGKKQLARGALIAYLNQIIEFVKRAE